MSLFNPFEQELLDAARLVLSDGLTRLQSRQTLFTNRPHEQKAAREARATVADYLRLTYGPLRHECGVVGLVDAQGRLIEIVELPQGKAAQCEISPRIVAGHICRTGAAGVFLAHNHPSGDYRPSQADIEFTEGFSRWITAMECELIAHLVVTTHVVKDIMGNWK